MSCINNSETHFNIDNIDYIKFRRRHKSKYIWQPMIPKKTRMFGLFTISYEIPAGWSEHAHGYRETPENLLKTKSFVCSTTICIPNLYPTYGTWYDKPLVIVRTKHGSHARYFDTDVEAEAWIAELKEVSKSEFEVINKK